MFHDINEQPSLQSLTKVQTVLHNRSSHREKRSARKWISQMLKRYKRLPAQEVSVPKYFMNSVIDIHPAFCLLF